MLQKVVLDPRNTPARMLARSLQEALLNAVHTKEDRSSPTNGLFAIKHKHLPKPLIVTSVVPYIMNKLIPSLVHLDSPANVLNSTFSIYAEAIAELELESVGVALWSKGRLSLFTEGVDGDRLAQILIYKENSNQTWELRGSNDTQPPSQKGRFWPESYPKLPENQQELVEDLKAIISNALSSAFDIAHGIVPSGHLSESDANDVNIKMIH